MKYSFMIFILLLACSSVNRIEKKTYYPDNKLNEEYFEIDGKKDGEYKNYYENGKLAAEGRFSNDIQVGTWKNYYNDGLIMSIIDYKAGFISNLNAWDRFGNHVVVNGNGIFTFFDEYGIKKSKLCFKNNRLSDTCCIWFQNGNLKEETIFKDGKPFIKKKWDEQGNFLEEKYYNK